MKKVLNISISDYANFGHDNAEALRAVGVDCVDIALTPHIFNYPSSSKIVAIKDVDRYLKWADVIQCFHSPNGLSGLLKQTGKPVIVYHTGTGYRQTPEKIHKLFDGWVKLHVCALPELYEQFKSRSTEKCVYMVGAVADFPQGNKPKKPFVVGHFPSNPEVKGTVIIDRVFQALEAEGMPLLFDLDTDRIPYEDQMKRYQRCDIYVEMMATHQTGKEYGSFGITALEAAAMGKIVITNCTHFKPYQKYYGAFPFQIANTEADLSAQLAELAMMDEDELFELQTKLRQLLLSMHGYKATGEYLLKNVLEGLL